jgi:hypothetical protein
VAHVNDILEITYGFRLKTHVVSEKGSVSIFMGREERIISVVYLSPFPIENRDRIILINFVGF